MIKMKVQTKWVKGHSGNVFNEKCDVLANKARLQQIDLVERKEKKAAGESLIGTKKKGTVSIWYRDILKIIDFDKNIVEDYDRDRHGPRGSALEIREEKSR